MVECIWADQQSLPADDRGLAYGDGLFETIRVHSDQPTLFDYHVRRLFQGAERLSISLAFDDIVDTIQAAVERYGNADDWILKIILTRGTGGRGYRPDPASRPRMIASRHVLPPVPQAGIAVSTSECVLTVDPLLAGLKTLNRLPQVLASQSMPDWAYEALMTSGHGDYLEGTKTNLFARLDDRWVTPPVEQLAVAGVARQAVIDYLDSAGEPIDYRAITPDDLRHTDFQGLAITNSIFGAIPVAEIDGLRLPTGPCLAKIRSFLAEALGF
ncbi:aminodeoxychorismate lyase [Marinobacter nanhaiticus D15-8W]|uniref:Aminodeoxychorismate lyase n=1 Tax=Marinobacter nanhaiticus D15-8W TaxID=626887 RepID=N6W0H4_9GAMM|nr:aminodeoxychorismate lyase [Marinobacter nanhaiticus]ENO13614.1 aminodeoxychorismate lyase [Marinobacter nanhaiticus D15-8W]BES70985.1 aminodeoxychorismate lyase [Marinobacter nanhaiticus D15-8W]